MLEPGTYETTQSTPALRNAVPAGWTNGEDLPGNFLLHRVDDTQDGFVGGSYIGIYSDLAAASLDCRETPQVGVGRTPHALARWFGSIPGIRVITPRAVTVGGLDELLIDVSVPPTYTKICPWSEARPVVPLIIGGGTLSSRHHVALRELSV